MTGGLWIALVLGGILGGLGAVFALSLPPGRDTFGAITTLSGVILSAWSLGRLIGEYRNAPVPAIATALGAGAFFGGFSLASALLPQSGHRQEPNPISATTGRRAALLLLSDAEIETYSPSATALELVALQDDDVLNLGIVSTPFLFAAQKARYRAIGGISPARRQVREVLEALETSVSDTPLEYFGLAWCSGDGNLRDQVDDLARAGYSRIVVLPLGIGESLEMVRAKTLLDRSRPAEAGVTVAYAAPLRSADEIAGLVAGRITAGLGPPGKTGVALVAHGQPDTQAEQNPDLDENEAAFVNRIKMLFSEDDVDQSNIRLTWGDWREPDVTSTVRHLAALGCDRILVAPVCYPVDCIATLLDMPIAIRQARIDAAVSVVTLSTWRDELEVVGALRAKALEALRELEAVPAEQT